MIFPNDAHSSTRYTLPRTTDQQRASPEAPVEAPEKMWQASALGTHPMPEAGCEASRAPTDGINTRILIWYIYMYIIYGIEHMVYGI